ncbi:MAG TPA: SRPBCC family protein, partial [Actinomycetota bacterium]|nr:SRPBCC family protein [Actinomycetota bacterium]
MRVQAAAMLPVPPDRAWAFLLRWEEQARWMPDADSVRVLTRRREGVGTWIAVRTRVLHVPLFTEELEVVRWEPPRRMDLAHRGPVRGRGTWELSEARGGTRLTWTEELELPVPLFGELALIAYRPFLRRL